MNSRSGSQFCPKRMTFFPPGWGTGVYLKNKLFSFSHCFLATTKKYVFLMSVSTSRSRSSSMPPEAGKNKSPGTSLRLVRDSEREIC